MKKRTFKITQNENEPGFHFERDPVKNRVIRVFFFDQDVTPYVSEVELSFKVDNDSIQVTSSGRSIMYRPPLNEEWSISFKNNTPQNIINFLESNDVMNLLK